MSQFPIQTEGPHPGEFILSEANSERSRDNAYLAGAVTIKVGTPLKKTAGATTDTPATYVVATVGADCQALSIYGGTGDAVKGLRVSIIARDAEVNGRLINWGAITPAEQVIGAQTLATAGIVTRV